jgi:hypothetical protein
MLVIAANNHSLFSYRFHQVGVQPYAIRNHPSLPDVELRNELLTAQEMFGTTDWNDRDVVDKFTKWLAENRPSSSPLLSPINFSQLFCAEQAEKHLQRIAPCSKCLVSAGTLLRFNLSLLKNIEDNLVL